MKIKNIRYGVLNTPDEVKEFSYSVGYNWKNIAVYAAIFAIVVQILRGVV